MGMNNNEEKRSVGAHNLILEERGNLTITGVEDVDSFDEETVVVYTGLGELTVRGSGLHINLPSFFFLILMLMPFVRPAWINSFFYPEIVLSSTILNLIYSLIQMLSPVPLVFFGSGVHILSFLLRIAFCWLGCRSVKKA